MNGSPRVMERRLESVEVFVGCALAGVTLVRSTPDSSRRSDPRRGDSAGDRARLHGQSLGEIARRSTGLDELRALIAIGRGDRVAARTPTNRCGDRAQQCGRWSSRLQRSVDDDIAVIATRRHTAFPKATCFAATAPSHTCTRLVPYAQVMVTNGAGTFIGSFSFVSALWGILYPHCGPGHVGLADPADPAAWIDHMAP